MVKLVLGSAKNRYQVKMWKPVEILSYAQTTALLFETSPMTKDNQDPRLLHPNQENTTASMQGRKT